MLMPCSRQALRRRRSIGLGHLVDDSLNDDDLNVDVAGYVRQELGDEVVDGRECQPNPIPLRAGRQVGLAVRHVEVADLVVDGRTHEVGVVHHALAVVALRPDHLQNGVTGAPRD